MAHSWMVDRGFCGAAIFFSISAMAQTGTIKLGASIQLSEPLADNGRYRRDAYNLAIKNQRRERSSPSEERAKFELVTLNNQPIPI